MPSDYRAIGNEILNELKIDASRLGKALSAHVEVFRACLESRVWDKAPAHSESAHELCDKMRGSEWSNVIDIAHAEGIFHAYEGISHLYQAEEAKEKRNFSEEREELAKAIYCLEKGQQSFCAQYRDQWNEVIICMNLGKLYRSQNRLNKALLAFQKSDEKVQEIVKVVSAELEKTRMLFKVLPVIDEITAGKERPASDDIIGHMRQTDELEFKFEGQALGAKLLRGSRLTFLQEYDYFAVPVSGDSMDQADISPKDYVILRKAGVVSLQPSSGDIVAVVFRDEDNKATLKRLLFDKSSGSVTLKPESSNPAHETRVLRPEAFAGNNPSVEVVGIAIAVLKP